MSTQERMLELGAAESDERRRARRKPWVREVVIVLSFYWVYQAIRKAANHPGSTTRAFANANRLVGWERALRIYNEQFVQSLFLGSDAVIRAINVYYGTLHFLVTAGLLVWLFLRRPHQYRRMRNLLGTTTGLALIGYWTMPLAPPRLLPCNESIPVPGGDPIGQCFVDTLHTVGGLWSYQSPAAQAVANNFAAMPSLHFGWSLWCGLVFAWCVGGRAGRLLAVGYPMLTLFAIVVTANHYWLDAAGGAVALLGALAIQFAWSRRQAHRALANALDEHDVASAAPGATQMSSS
jgi:PAP2 superfamily